jgi:uncharacterized protein (UPF0276 family)
MDQLSQENSLQLGVGIRSQHFKFFTKKHKGIDILEAHPENFFGDGVEHNYLEKISQMYKLTFHGVGLSLGSEERIDKVHLKKIRELIEKYNPIAYSEHIAWTKAGNVHFHDLLPVDYTNNRLKLLVRNIKDTQDYLGQQIYVENPSYYINIDGEMEEFEFLNKVCEQADCKLLLDINNLYVNSVNHKFDPRSYIDRVNLDFVKEIHLAGHSEEKISGGKVIIDTHDNFVTDDVWSLYRYFVHKTNDVFFTIIEWDQKLPKPQELINEAKKAQHIIKSC